MSRTSRFSDSLRDHYEHPRHVGSLRATDPDVITVHVSARDCGDQMRLQARITQADELIEDAKFKVFGCGAAIASASFTTDWLSGRTVEQAASFDARIVIDALELMDEHRHCADLATDAVRSLVKAYRSR
jgi:nitrogen fixation NifU-like protein